MMESDNKSSLEKLREIFEANLDLEQDLYNLYESKLDNEGLKIDLMFNEHDRLDYLKFLQTYSLWQILYGSVQYLDLEKINFRKGLFKPWFNGKDFINIELQIGKFTKKINNHNSNGISNVYNFKELLMKTTLGSNSNIDGWTIFDIARELKSSKKISFIFKRSKKDASNLRTSLEMESYITDSIGFQQYLEQKFQLIIEDVLVNKYLIIEEVFRMHLQERLIFWNYSFTTVLPAHELHKQYKVLKLKSAFPNVIEAQLYLDYMQYNSNKEVLNQIQNDDYKKIIYKLLNILEQDDSIVMHYAIINLENLPEFRIG